MIKVIRIAIQAISLFSMLLLWQKSRLNEYTMLYYFHHKTIILANCKCMYLTGILSGFAIKEALVGISFRIWTANRNIVFCTVTYFIYISGKSSSIRKCEKHANDKKNCEDSDGLHFWLVFFIKLKFRIYEWFFILFAKFVGKLCKFVLELETGNFPGLTWSIYMQLLVGRLTRVSDLEIIRVNHKETKYAYLHAMKRDMLMDNI